MYAPSLHMLLVHVYLSLVSSENLCSWAELIGELCPISFNCSGVA